MADPAAPPRQIKAWFNPDMEAYVATPVDGEWADEMFGTGSTEREAVDRLVAGLRERGVDA